MSDENVEDGRRLVGVQGPGREGVNRRIKCTNERFNLFTHR